MHDLRHPEQPEQPVSQPQPQQPSETKQDKTGTFVNNIYNYTVPTQLKRFNYASVFTIVLTISLLIIVGLVAWKTGAIEHIINVFRSLL